MFCSFMSDNHAFRFWYLHDLPLILYVRALTVLDAWTMLSFSGEFKLILCPHIMHCVDRSTSFSHVCVTQTNEIFRVHLITLSTPDILHHLRDCALHSVLSTLKKKSCLYLIHSCIFIFMKLKVWVAVPRSHTSQLDFLQLTDGSTIGIKWLTLCSMVYLILTFIISIATSQASNYPIPSLIHFKIEVPWNLLSLD